MAKLTKGTADSARPKDRPYEIRDSGNGAVRGLLLRVQPSGTRTYYFEYRRAGRVRIGSSALTLTRARELAKEVAQKVSEGKDPKKTIIGSFQNLPASAHSVFVFT